MHVRASIKTTKHETATRGVAGERRVNRPKRRRKLSELPAYGQNPLVLFLAANPHDAGRLDLPRECAEIQRELTRVPIPRLRFEARWAVSIDDAMRHITELDPTVVHLSGHGGSSATVVLEDDRGESQPVTGRALAMMIEAAGRHVRAVIVNACVGLADAAALRDVVDCVIGCDQPITDAAARVFVVRFYAALVAGRSIGNAVAHGTATLVARQLDDVLPRCETRDGVDANAVVLVRRTAKRTRPRSTG